MVQEARDFYRFVLALGRHKSSLLHPEVSSDQGDGVGEGRAGFVIPRRGARRHGATLFDQDIRCQRHHAEQAKDWGLRFLSRVGKRIYESVVQSGRDFPYIRVSGGQ